MGRAAKANSERREEAFRIFQMARGAERTSALLRWARIVQRCPHPEVTEPMGDEGERACPGLGCEQKVRGQALVCPACEEEAERRLGTVVYPGYPSASTVPPKPLKIRVQGGIHARPGRWSRRR